MMLHLLHQCQPTRLRFPFDRQVNEDGLGHRVVNQILNVRERDFEVLWLYFATVNDGRDASGNAQFFDPASSGQGARKRFQ